MIKSFAVLAAAAAVAFPTAAQAQQKVRIGFISTMSGPPAIIGKHMKDSVEVALDHLGRKMNGMEVEVFYGVGSLGADHTVSIASGDATATITGDNVLLATGSVPRLIPNFERGGPIMTSDEVLDLDYVPGRVAVIGGGAIGCEFASTFADLGAKVTILEFLIRCVGADRVMLGSDYCFDMGVEQPVAAVMRASLEAEEQRQILGGTAARLLGID